MCSDETGVKAWHGLEALLVAFFNDGELRLLAEVVFVDRWSVSGLPGAGASVQELVRCIVSLVRRTHAAPPTGFWVYLHDTRSGRKPEIEAVRALFGRPVERAASADVSVAVRAEPAIAIRRVEAACGSCDLLAMFAGLRVQGESELPACVAALVPGVVNGMCRVLTLTWTARTLVLEATPSAFDGAEPRPNRIVWTTPIYQQTLLYYPHGCHYYREGRMPPRVVLAIDAWDERVRRLSLGEADGGSQVSLEFLYSGGGRG